MSPPGSWLVSVKVITKRPSARPVTLASVWLARVVPFAVNSPLAAVTSLLMVSPWMESPPLGSFQAAK